MTNTETKIVRSDDEQIRANEMFDSLRDELLKRDLSNTENYDKAILTLSAASLGLSLTAIRFVVPLESAEFIWLIQCGWLLLLGSIITSISAFLLSNKAIGIQLTNAEDYYINCIAQAFNRKNLYIRINGILNHATGLMFIIAITAIVAFVIVNISLETANMSKKSDDNSTTVNIRKSANIPTMQRIPTDSEISINSANIPTMQQAPETQTTSQGGSSDSGSGSSGGSDKSE